MQRQKRWTSSLRTVSYTHLYRLHYIILGADSTVYSVADGIDNSSYFGEKFAQSVRQQPWYREFLEGKEVSDVYKRQA